MRSISVIGLGYVGLSLAVAFGLKGFKVVGVDIDPRKIGAVNKGLSPIKEPGVVENLPRLVREGLVEATSDYRYAVEKTEASLIAVNTPPALDGRADLRQLESAIKSIGKVLSEDFHLVVVCSTVPPGTTSSFVKPLLERVSGRKVGLDVGLAIMPEFLREGSAVQDILRPWRVVIGVEDEKSKESLLSIIKVLYGTDLPALVITNYVNAELIKYTSNAFLAARVSFINTLARLCEALPGADIDIVAYGAGLDPRIGTSYFTAGPGYGGICLPKDLKALIKVFEDKSLDPILLKAIDRVNEEQIRHVVEITRWALGGLKNRKICVLGLAFKAGTDDVRESPGVKIARKLAEEGADVKVYDPLALDNARKELGVLVKYAESLLDAVKGCDAVIITTDDSEFNKLNIDNLAKTMRRFVIIDTKRLLKNFRNKIVALGGKYYAIGLGY